MEIIDLEQLLLNVFKEDFNRNKRYSYISQLTVIAIKALMPMVDEHGIRIDYTRFVEELKLWVSYRNGENSSLLNTQGRVNPDIYWKEKDDSIISRIIPLVLVNQEYRVIEEEVIKNVMFSTGNLQSLFDSIYTGYLLYLVLNKEENIIDKLKENAIGFSQREFIDKYKKYYRIEILDYPGKFKIEFEKERIHLLNTLNGIKSNRFVYLEDCIDVLNKVELETFIGSILYDFMYLQNREYDIPKFYTNLGNYVLRLRKSRIDPAQLVIKEYILPDVFSYTEGEIFFHSLLGDTKVIKKEVKGNSLTSLVQTKTGMYLFKR
ncbi:hypothetical protein [Tissierella sp.]|uniref:hypothetical protein n=1 Tax=Tissierella sp. TaxID=41274 RepID=UPI00286682D5|nr:hypothetical protein [Tissierella sp.]MDR7856452.1 hypothetical protein [Tissierella sp.]